MFLKSLDRALSNFIRHRWRSFIYFFSKWSRLVYDLWKKGQEGPDHEEGWESWQFTTLQGGNVPESEIEAARRDLDAKTFDQEYNATLFQFSGLVYYGFNREDSILVTILTRRGVQFTLELIST